MREDNGDDKVKARGKAKKKVNKWGRVPTTQTHNIFTHFPKCKDCEICNRTKTQRAQCRQSSGQPDGLPEPVEFGGAITLDHAIINEYDKHRDHDTKAVLCHDRATRWQQAFPAPTKCAEQTGMDLQRFMGPAVKPKYIYTDGSHEFDKAARDIGWLHDSSTPYGPQNNGVAERAVRRCKEGTACSSFNQDLINTGGTWQWNVIAFCATSWVSTPSKCRNLLQLIRR